MDQTEIILLDTMESLKEIGILTELLTTVNTQGEAVAWKIRVTGVCE